MQVHTAALVYLGERGLGCLRGSQFAECVWGGGEGLHVLLHTFPGVWGKRAARTPGARRSIFAEESL